jgi:pyridoxal phosphate enzyme (YggS family)
VDSEHLLQAIDRQAEKLGIRQDILIEVNIGQESSKGGVAADQTMALALQTAALDHVRLRGLMAIPPPAERPEENRAFFAAMRQLFVDIRLKMDDNNANINCLSMGMSDDFEEAIAQGATLVRVGTALFGPRPAPVHL